MNRRFLCILAVMTSPRPVLSQTQFPRLCFSATGNCSPKTPADAPTSDYFRVPDIREL
jgi:hypothetical protein